MLYSESTLNSTIILKSYKIPYIAVTRILANELVHMMSTVAKLSFWRRIGAKEKTPVMIILGVRSYGLLDLVFISSLFSVTSIHLVGKLLLDGKRVFKRNDLIKLNVFFLFLVIKQAQHCIFQLHLIISIDIKAEKGLGKPSMRRKVHTSTESGTCNVCFAPCSSCMHLKLACMGSKGDAFSDETCHVTASSQFSYNDGDGLVSFKSRACDSLQHTTSEASNLLSVSSSHDSLSENAESKVNRKSSDADASAESHMHPKMTSGRAVAEDQFSLKAESFPDQKTFSKTHVNSKSEEGHDDNISCVSRANYASEVVSYHNKNLDMNNCLHSSALEAEGSGKALLSHKSGSFETPSNDVDAGSSSPKVQTKCLSSNANAAATIDCVGNLAAHNIADNQANGKSTLDADSSKVSCKINSKLELDADKDSGDQADEGFKCSDQIERKEKLNEPDELADIPMLQSASGDESDESEILEHDVKVCDICGDAGREDSLAICSRCADGAEHIYCMREMLQNLPEGDWLCEECKLIEEAENQKQDAEEKRMNVASTQNSGKRHAEPVELASAPKKQATETSLASPKSCSPSRIAAVSRDTSSKSLDKGKVKIGHQTSFGNKSCIDIPEIARPSVKWSTCSNSQGGLIEVLFIQHLKFQTESETC
ncbi:hypothetical protein OIU76_023849 [Salix suchowensis]|nr:hypothetical protein OIU76_023849 [Salix suchowensis]